MFHLDCLLLIITLLNSNAIGLPLKDKTIAQEDIELGSAYIQVVAVDANSKSTLASDVVVRIIGEKNKVESYAISNEAGLIYYMPLPPGRYCYDAFTKNGKALRMVRKPSERCFSLDKDSEVNIGVEFWSDDRYIAPKKNGP